MNILAQAIFYILQIFFNILMHAKEMMLGKKLSPIPKLKTYSRKQMYQYDDPNLKIDKYKFFDIRLYILQKNMQTRVKKDEAPKLQLDQNIQDKKYFIIQEKTHQQINLKLHRFLQTDKKSKNNTKYKKNISEIVKESNQKLQQILWQIILSSQTNVHDQIVLQIINFFLRLKQKYIDINQENYNNILKICLEIKNLEWSAFILHEIFQNSQVASRELLDEFILLNQKKISEKSTNEDSKFMKSIFQDQLIKFAYQDILPLEQYKEFDRIEQIWTHYQNTSTNKVVESSFDQYSQF